MTCRVTRLVVLMTVLLGVCLALSTVASACPTCKVALANHDASQGDIVSGYFWSILFMMSMPFVMVGSVGAWIVYMYWRGGRDEHSDAHPLALPREEVS